MNTISFRFVLTTSIVFILCFVLVAGEAFAACQAFVPLNRTLKLEDAANKGLLIYEDGMETLVFEPSFTGSADDFALVLALPNQPIIEEAPDNIFQKLNTQTEKIIRRGGGGRSIFGSSATSSSVGSHGSPIRIVEEKNVGQYKTTILTADTSDGLLDWLKTNDYNVKKEILPTLEYYVQKSSHYFVILKVNFDVFEDNLKDSDVKSLNPISFTFESEEPIFPIRIMASGLGKEDVIAYTLYAIAGKPLYIPGTTLWHSDKLRLKWDANDDPFHRYSLDNKWLTRTDAKIDRSKILEDYVLEEGNSRLKVSKRIKARIVNSFATPTKSGFVTSEKGSNFIFINNWILTILGILVVLLTVFIRRYNKRNAK